MSAALHRHAPCAGVPHPFARTGAFVRAQARRLRKSLAARERYDQLPVGPRQVMDAAIRLAALHAEDGAHWRPRQPGPEAAELVRAIRPGVVGVVTDAQIVEWLGYLEREELISLAGGGLRLSILDEDAFWKPAPSRAKATPPAPARPPGKLSKADQAKINGLYYDGPRLPGESDAEFDARQDLRRRAADRVCRSQGHFTFVLPGGARVTGEMLRRQMDLIRQEDAAPAPRNRTQEGTQEGTQGQPNLALGPTHGDPVGFSVGSVGSSVGCASRAPGVGTPVVVAVEEINNINNLTTTTAAVLPTPRLSAGARAGTQGEPEATQDPTQASPAAPAEGAPNAAGKAGSPADAFGPFDATLLAQRLVRLYPKLLPGPGSEMVALCKQWRAAGPLDTEGILRLVAETWAKNQGKMARGTGNRIVSFHYFTNILEAAAETEQERAAAIAAAPDPGAAAAQGQGGPSAPSYNEQKYQLGIEQVDRGDWRAAENTVSVLKKTAPDVIARLFEARPQLRAWLNGDRMQA